MKIDNITDMRIENIQPQTVAYMRRVGPYGPENFSVMDSLKSWAWGKGLLQGATLYGIAHDDSDTEPSECRYDACIVIDAPSQADDRVEVGELPGGCYAVFEVAHSTPAIEAFWMSFLDVMESEGLVIDESRPIMERYRESMIREGKSEFCVPVA